MSDVMVDSGWDDAEVLLVSLHSSNWFPVAQVQLQMNTGLPPPRRFHGTHPEYAWVVLRKVVERIRREDDWVLREVVEQIRWSCSTGGGDGRR